MDHIYPVNAYIPAPDEAIKGIAYNVLDEPNPRGNPRRHPGPQQRVPNCRSKKAGQDLIVSNTFYWNPQGTQPNLFVRRTIPMLPLPCQNWKPALTAYGPDTEPTSAERKDQPLQPMRDATPGQGETGLHSEMHPVQRRPFHGHQKLQGPLRKTQLQGKITHRKPMATRTTTRQRRRPFQEPGKVQRQPKIPEKSEPLHLLPSPPESRQPRTPKTAELETADHPRERWQRRAQGYN
ncbi:hypothetical protein HPB49_023999 [Dermacentor silvarum]|uniref:Uncharacterized protein n=1 Tax=Dermacentor silvarum TaxID=543639 RepID=A0ACB8CNE4_DERSI|nr:hypothetical protein HPB49_023999 [Dermacentor silvarum]